MLLRWRHQVSLMSLRLQGEGRIVHGPQRNHKLRTWFNIENHLHGFFPKRHHRIKSSQVEIVFDEIFSDLAKVLVAGQGTEPADPCQS